LPKQNPIDDARAAAMQNDEEPSHKHCKSINATSSFDCGTMFGAKDPLELLNLISSRRQLLVDITIL
jgi:hypothetical protein